MSEQLYTVCRPLLANVLNAPPGAVLTVCRYCGQECWKLNSEPDPLPDGVRAACTGCALKRAFHQRTMDAAEAARNGGQSREP